MKLNFLHNKNETLDESLETDTEETITRPIGISAEEWTIEFAEHLKALRKRNPDLYKKIQSGN